MKNKTQEKLEDMFIEIIKENFIYPNETTEEEFVKLLEQCEKEGGLPY